MANVSLGKGVGNWRKLAGSSVLRRPAGWPD